MSDKYAAGSNVVQQTNAAVLMRNEEIVGITKAAGHHSMCWMADCE